MTPSQVRFLVTLMLFISVLFQPSSSAIFTAQGVTGFDIEIHIGATQTTVTARISSEQESVWHAIGFGCTEMKSCYAVIQGVGTAGIPTFTEHRLKSGAVGQQLSTGVQNSTIWAADFHTLTDPYTITMTRDNNPFLGSNYYTFDPSATTLSIIYAVGISDTLADGHDAPNSLNTKYRAETLISTSSAAPTAISTAPTNTPTTNPSAIPSMPPSLSPSLNPTYNPSLYKTTLTPTNTPSIAPISISNPTLTPVYPPSIAPISLSLPPTSSPTLIPTYNPANDPIYPPSIAPVSASLPSTSSPTLTQTYPPSTAPSLSSTPFSLVTQLNPLSTRETVSNSEDENITIHLMAAADIKFVIIIILLIVIVIMIVVIRCRYKKIQRDPVSFTPSKHRTFSASDGAMDINEPQKIKWTKNVMNTNVVEIPALHLHDEPKSGSLSKSIKKVAHKLHPHPNNADFTHNLTEHHMHEALTIPKYALQPPHININTLHALQPPHLSVSSHEFNKMPSHQSSYMTANTSHEFNKMPSNQASYMTVNTSHDLNFMPSVTLSVTEDEEAKTPLVAEEKHFGEASRMTLFSDISPNITPVGDTQNNDTEMEGMLVQLADASSQKNLETPGGRNVFKQYENKMMDASSKMNALEEKQEYESSERSDQYSNIMQKYQTKSVDAASTLSFENKLTPGNMMDASSKKNVLETKKEYDEDEMNDFDKYSNIANKYQSKNGHHLQTADASSARNSVITVIIHEDNEMNDDVVGIPMMADASSENNENPKTKR